MPRLINLVPEHQPENIADDFRSSQKIEQYRLGQKALYIPEGLRWNYLPLEAIRRADESFRVISGGHCVPIREKRPELDLDTAIGPVHLQLEKKESMKKILDAL